MTTRRDFVITALTTSATAFTGATLLRSAAADTTTDGSAALDLFGARGTDVAPPGTVDWHNHWFSPRSVAILKQRTSAPRLETNAHGQLVFVSSVAGVSGGLPLALEFTDVDARIRHLDRFGISRQVISWPTTLGADALLSADEAKPLWSAYNEDLSALVKQHPDRFSGFAALPTSDIAWAASELERAHTQLGLIGAVLPVGAIQTRAGARQLAPIFDVAEKFHSHIYFHTGPASPGISGQTTIVAPEDDVPWIRNNHETSSSFANGAITLTQTDFLDPYPNVTVQIAMLGGSSALLASWLALYPRAHDGGDPTLRLRRIYFDTGVYGRDSHLTEFATEVIGADRILFGTDYPLATTDKTIAAINNSSISDADKRLIYLENGRGLLATAPAVA